MKAEGVVLVVPGKYKASYPSEYRNEIFSLEQFIREVKGHQ
jgi:hypothetical protein